MAEGLSHLFFVGFLFLLVYFCPCHQIQMLMEAGTAVPDHRILQ